MDTFCIHNARKMRTNFSLVYISTCTFKCPIKITRQSSNSCDAGSHRCAELPGNTLANTVPAIIWRRRPPLPTPAPRNLPFATLLGSKETYLSLHNPLIRACWLRTSKDITQYMLIPADSWNLCSTVVLKQIAWDCSVLKAGESCVQYFIVMTRQ